MSLYILYLLATVSAFISMEGVAWFAHKYVMHGLLWSWHRDHHQVEPDSFLEKNDLFFIVFALPGISLIIFGSNGFTISFWLGLGIALYGLCYFVVHDVFIHRRLSLFKHTKLPYFKALRKAHKIHHKKQERKDGECFGMLWGPRKYFKEARQSNTPI